MQQYDSMSEERFVQEYLLKHYHASMGDEVLKDLTDEAKRVYQSSKTTNTLNEG